MESRQAILPDTLRVNATPFQTDLCRYPVHRDVFGLPSLAFGFRHSLPERRFWGWVKFLASE
ncbi:MAG: hypothetical protein PHY16_14395 [Methylobacter sp.]|nr:hypothetical protein [Methylobacter sp.]